MKSLKPIELLAPARDLECGLAAINAGADAVYIGGPCYGARENASNNLEDIGKLVRYAHLFNAKIYVTLNTLLFDHELDNANKLAWMLYNEGVDAFLIQDMAFMMMDMPPVALHASTQTNNYEIERIKFLSDSGFSRIVLARELTTDQISEIRKTVKTELEFFVHGSLCVSLSGQCYLSYAIGGRSANRGACAQPCRRKYTLTDNRGRTIIKDKHLLSLKDLNLSEYIGELAEAGIDSFKIEGRLKDAQYVRNITAYYRKCIDDYLSTSSSFKKASAGNIKLDFDPDPHKSFNRGATDYFLHGRKPNICSPDTPKSLGEEIGTVKDVTAGWFEIITGKTISNNDGLVFLNRKGDAVGIKVNRATGNRIYPDSLNGIFPGAKIFRNYDHRFNLQMNPESAIRKLAISIKLKDAGDGITIIAENENGLTSELTENAIFPAAMDKEKSFAIIKSQLTKAGNTPFEIASVDTGGCEKYFFQASFLNRLRRTVLEMLKEKLESSVSEYVKPGKSEIKTPYKSVGFEANVSNSLAGKFYEKNGIEVLEPAPETSFDITGKRVMTTKHCLRYFLQQCPKYNRNAEELSLPLFLTDGSIRLRLDFNCRDCFMNVYFEEK